MSSGEVQGARILPDIPRVSVFLKWGLVLADQCGEYPLRGDVVVLVFPGWKRWLIEWGREGKSGEAIGVGVECPLLVLDSNVVLLQEQALSC